MVSPTAHTRQTPGVIITNRVSALIAWFPARWANQIAPRLIRCNNAQDVSHVYIQNVRSGALSRPTGAEGEKGASRSDGLLLAVRFADNRAPGTAWDIDNDFIQRNSFSAIVTGHDKNLIQPAVMKNFHPMGGTRAVLDVIVPSATGIIAERWRKDATVCPVNWPIDYSLLPCVVLKGSLHQYLVGLYRRTGCPYTFEAVTLDVPALAGRIFFARPAVYLAQVNIDQQWADMDFPNRSLK